MLYEGIKEQNTLMRPYQDHAGRDDIELFCGELTDNVQYLLSNLKVLMLYKEKINLDFNKLINLIHKTIESEESFDKIIDHDLQGSWKNYGDWSPLNGVEHNLSTIQRFYQQSATDTLDDIVASLVDDIDDYEEIDDAEEAILTPIFHTLIETHVRDVTKRLQEAKCLENYAEFLSHNELIERDAPSDQDTILLMRSKLAQLDLTISSTTDVNQLIKNIIVSAKELFNYENSPKFYTFCIRIFDNIIISSDISQRLSAHCAHSDYSFNENINRLSESVLAFSDHIAENVSSSIIAKHAVSFLRRERKAVIELIYDNMLPSESSRNLMKQHNNMRDHFDVRRVLVAHYEKQEDKRENSLLKKNDSNELNGNNKRAPQEAIDDLGKRSRKTLLTVPHTIEDSCAVKVDSDVTSDQIAHQSYNNPTAADATTDMTVRK